MLGNLKIMLMSIMLFFAKMLVATKLKDALVGMVGLTTTDRFKKLGVREFKNTDIINFAFFMGICFTYVNKYLAEKVLTRIFIA
ncbi:hypothetical protein CPAV1605_622 [seawater metagenome]|uniref:Uncharacterized protein n=1 Tax=seawater metagenome TaxID=1561972 RepID=A0A5E8CIJ5_9ZZZZ